MWNRAIGLVGVLFALALPTGAWAAWVQIDKEQPPGSSAQGFGWAVAIDGDLAVVGDPWGGLQSGAAYVYQRGLTGDWTLLTTLQPPGGTSGARFGFSVDISNTPSSCHAVVGASFDELGMGSAFVFSCGNWANGQKIVASDRRIGDTFGFSVAVNGGRLIVGAIGNDGGNVSNAGAAYAFERGTNGVWSETQKLIANNPEAGAALGQSVDLGSSRAVVGAMFANVSGVSNAGAAYVFDLEGSTWSQSARLVADDPTPNNQFAWAVALSGNSVVVGAPGEDEGGSNSGAVYAYRSSASGWSQESKIKAFDSEAGDGYGSSVDMRAGWLAVGAPTEDEGGPNAGAIYVRERDACGFWRARDKIVANDAEFSDTLGRSVGAAVRAGSGLEFQIFLTVLGGADGDRPAGSAYWFEDEIAGTSHGCNPSTVKGN